MNYKKLILGFLFLLISINQVYSLDCNLIKNILTNIDTCNLKNVNVTGGVDNIDFKISAKGNEYTTFYIRDENNNKIQVFTYGHLDSANNDIVNIRGIFYKEKKKDSYIFNNEIEADLANIFVVKSAKSINYYLIYIVPVFIVILSILTYVVLRKKDWNYAKGKSFEEYVISLFNENEWKLIKKSPDTIRTLHRISEEDSYYDFIIKHRKTNKSLIIQCKYRTLRQKNLNNNKLTIVKFWLFFIIYIKIIVL